MTVDAHSTLNTKLFFVIFIPSPRRGEFVQELNRYGSQLLFGIGDDPFPKITQSVFVFFLTEFMYCSEQLKNVSAVEI